MKNAFSDLKIVDVRRKPAGLGVDLKADKAFMDDPENQRSLRAHGYYVNPTPTGEYELFAANGEVYVGMKDGYEYVLRFGSVAMTDEGTGDGSLNRYLFVTARVDYSKFPVPELEPDPTIADLPAPEGSDAPAPPATDDNEKEGESDQENDVKKDDGKNKEAEEDDGKNEEAEEDDEKNKEAEEDDGKNEEAEEDDGKNEEAEEDGEKNEEAEEDGEKNKEAEEERQRQLQAAIERVQKENKRKMDAWKEDKKKAEDKVNELNSRFSAWYYIIAEDVYKRVHLSRNDIIKENANAIDEGFGIDAFRKLQKDGVNPPPPSPPGLPADGGFPGGPPF
jgi:hypothetical protein